MLFYHDVKNRKIIIVDMEPFFFKCNKSNLCLESVFEFKFVKYYMYLKINK